METSTGVQVNVGNINDMIVSTSSVASIADLDVTSRNTTIETKGGVIQANMDVRDVSYFNVRRENNEAYMISNFRCEATKKFTQIFEAYNELDARKTVRNAILAGNRCELTIWSDMATGLDVKPFEEMEKPVINVVTSCRVFDYKGGYAIKILHSYCANI
ncbi:nucleic acid-binding, OB-fold protein [Tanacetum coccineum]